MLKQQCFNNKINIILLNKHYFYYSVTLTAPIYSQIRHLSLKLYMLINHILICCDPDSTAGIHVVVLLNKHSCILCLDTFTMMKTKVFSVHWILSSSLNNSKVGYFQCNIYIYLFIHYWISENPSAFIYITIYIYMYVIIRYYNIFNNVEYYLFLNILLKNIFISIYLCEILII